MPIYQIEMLWRCPCGKSGNRGLVKTCPNCGRGKTEDCEEYFPDDVSERAALAPSKQKKSPDWTCKYCDALQSSTEGICEACGVDQGTGARPNEIKSVRLTENADGSGRRVSTGDAPAWGPTPRRDTPNATTPDVELSHVTGKDRRRYLPALFIGAGAAVLFLIVYLLFRSHQLNAGVRSVAWSHTVVVERYHLFEHDGWAAPAGAEDVRNLGPRVHHYNHVLVGSHQESFSASRACGQTCTTPSCYTTSRSCTSGRNGTANCSGGDRVCPSPSCSTKYCSYTDYRTVNDYTDIPQYWPYFSWKEWDWGHNRNVTKVGTGMETTWANSDDIRLCGTCGPGEQERVRQVEAYEVVLGHHGETWTLKPATEQEFKLYPVSSRHEIKVNYVGQIQVLRHGR